jgi:cystathionine beta-lyase/cystathionine gamma-synthase
MKHFNTIAVHAGREDLTALGVHSVPIDLSTTYPITSLEAGGATMDSALAGRGHVGNDRVYRRITSPNVERFEVAMTALETTRMAAQGADVSQYGAIGFASGMAAITAVLQSRVLAELPHVVAVRPIYGTSDHVLETSVMGTQVTWTDAEAIKDAITPQTGLIYIETPANPTLQLINLHQVVLAAGDIPVLVDNTFATPVLQQPLEHGVTFVVHSATKYIGGHGDAMGGVVVTHGEYVHAVRGLRAATGGLMDPFTAYLMQRGLTTLSVRVKAAQETAGEIVSWLTKQKKISNVYYPGLGDSDKDNLVGPGRQMTGPGAMVSFEMAGGFEAAAHVAQHVKLITHAVSLGGIDTLIEHPASFTHRMVDPDARTHAAVLRISVGLEHHEDLIADLEQAIAGA